MIHQGKDDYAIAALSARKTLFDPKDHRITPVGRCSACWRGYICTYTIADDELLLTELAVWLDGTPPVLFGVTPRRIQRSFASWDEFAASINDDNIGDFFFGGDVKYETCATASPTPASCSSLATSSMSSTCTWDSIPPGNTERSTRSFCARAW
jgi:hypothetical protein